MLGRRYRLVERLGQGGMGEVWAAYDEQLRRNVAVKVVLAALGGNRELIARLRQEAQTVAALQHPGITVVHDIGETDSHPYFVMELLDGQTFQDLLTEHPQGLPQDRVVSLMIQVAGALDYAHGKGVVHRDIKPANLMLMPDGTTKILDFGIASYAEATAHLSSTGVIMGSSPYMSPEQWLGEKAGPKADMYAFGTTVHVLLTGAYPFPGPTFAAWMRQHLDEAPPHLEGALDQLDDVIQRLLAKDATVRPSAEQAKQALSQVREHRPVTDPPIRKAPVPKPPAPRPSRSCTVQHTRQELLKRGVRAGYEKGVVLWFFALLGGAGGLALDGQFNHGTFPLWGGALFLGLGAGVIVSQCLGSVVGYVNTTSLTSDRVTLDGEKITVVQEPETRTVRWDDLSRIELDAPSGQLVVWFHENKAAEYSHLSAMKDFEDGTGRLLYTCARKDKDPEKLEDHKLRTWLKEYAGNLYHEAKQT